MEQIFAAWKTWLEALGCETALHFRPPTPGAAASLGKAIGFPLPDDLTALYVLADGQHDWLGIAASPGKWAVPVFGGYEFLSASQAGQEYQHWKQIFDDAGDDFEGDFNDGIITARAGDPVHPAYWRPGWLPFAKDGGGNAYAVDMSPPADGTYGQVILIGPDEDERRVLGPSISAWLAERMKHPPRLEEHEDHYASFPMEGF